MDLTVLPIKPPPITQTIDHDPRLPDLSNGSCVLHISPPRGGKTTTICNLLLNPNMFRDKFESVYVFSSTMTNGDASARHILEEWPETVFSEYSDNMLQSILDYQASFPKDERPPICIIFDDFLAFRLPQNSLAFKLASSFRHYGIALLYYSSQLYKSVPTVVRQCAHYFLTGQNHNKAEVRKMAEEMSGRFGGEDNFASLLEQATQRPYSFLYLDLYSRPATAYENFNNVIWQGPTNGEAPQPISAAGFER